MQREAANITSGSATSEFRRERIVVFDLTHLKGNSHSRAFDDVTLVMALIELPAGQQMSDDTRGCRLSPLNKSLSKRPAEYEREKPRFSLASCYQGFGRLAGEAISYFSLLAEVDQLHTPVFGRTCSDNLLKPVTSGSFKFFANRAV